MSGGLKWTLSSLPRNWTCVASMKNRNPSCKSTGGLEVRSKIPWSLLPLKNAFLKEAKLLLSCTKFITRDSPGSSEGKESACHVGDPASTSGLGRFPWRRKWQSTPVFLPGEINGQRSLADYSPWVCRGSDTTEKLTQICKVGEHTRKWVTQLYPTLCNPMIYIVHGILQARILEWVAVPFSRGSS